MHTKFACCCLALCVSLGVSPLWADSAVETKLINPNQIEFLVNGMEAANARISSVRVDMRSQERFIRDGQPRFDIATQTHWISRGPAFRYAFELQQLADGKPPPEPKANKKRSLVGERLGQRAFSGEIAVEFRSIENTAIIQLFQKSVAASLPERARHEPLFYGTSVMGLSLRDFVHDGSWRPLKPRPDIEGSSVTRTAELEGTREYDGRTVHVIKVVETESPSGSYDSLTRYITVFVDPTRGFTVPFIEVESEFNGTRKVIETVHTQSVNYGNDLWAPKETRHVIHIGKAGISETTISVENCEFNTDVSDKELKIALPDGTRVDDQVAGVYYEFGLKNEEDILSEITNSLREAGINDAVAIDSHALPKASSTSVEKHDPVPENRSSPAWLWVILASFLFLTLVVLMRFLARRHSEG